MTSKQRRASLIAAKAERLAADSLLAAQAAAVVAAVAMASSEKRGGALLRQRILDSRGVRGACSVLGSGVGGGGSGRSGGGGGCRAPGSTLGSGGGSSWSNVVLCAGLLLVREGGRGSGNGSVCCRSGPAYPALAGNLAVTVVAATRVAAAREWVVRYCELRADGCLLVFESSEPTILELYQIEAKKKSKFCLA
jgi:hypothetical protein